MALPLFCHSPLKDLTLEPLIGAHLLQSPVFVLQLLESCYQRRVHTAVFSAPVIEARGAHAVPPAELWRWRTSVGLLNDGYDLTV